MTGHLRGARLSVSLAVVLASGPVLADFRDIEKPPHDYWVRPLRDPFSRFKSDLESRRPDRPTLDRSSEKAYLTSLLAKLNVPVSSQMLVFSTTSLQLRLISPDNPRALYFNEDVYVGWVPGGRIEVASLDPEVGAIFYLVDIPVGGASDLMQRTDRCMNCHSGSPTNFLPGLVLKSVIPSQEGGSLDSLRGDETGHGVPFDRRFGGWYLTGRHGFTSHRGNAVSPAATQGSKTIKVEPATTVSRLDRYPVATSDALPQLLHEHQVGFANRAIEASYRARSHLHAGARGAGDSDELDRQADVLTRYLLFADENSLPAGGVTGDPAFVAAFLANRRKDKAGASLKDLDLGTRLFKHRCSYMIYSGVFQGLPPEIKTRVYQRVASALGTGAPDPRYAYLPAAEKKAIRAILNATLPDFPAASSAPATPSAKLR